MFEPSNRETAEKASGDHHHHEGVNYVGKAEGIEDISFGEPFEEIGPPESQQGGLVTNYSAGMNVAPKKDLIQMQPMQSPATSFNFHAAEFAIQKSEGEAACPGYMEGEVERSYELPGRILGVLEEQNELGWETIEWICGNFSVGQSSVKEDVLEDPVTSFLQLLVRAEEYKYWGADKRYWRQFMVKGLADCVDDETTNLDIASERASNVQHILQTAMSEAGIPGDPSIRVVLGEPLGESHIIPQGTEEERALSRGAVIVEQWVEIPEPWKSLLEEEEHKSKQQQGEANLDKATPELKGQLATDTFDPGLNSFDPDSATLRRLLDWLESNPTADDRYITRAGAECFFSSFYLFRVNENGEAEYPYGTGEGSGERVLAGVRQVALEQCSTSMRAQLNASASGWYDDEGNLNTDKALASLNSKWRELETALHKVNTNRQIQQSNDGNDQWLYLSNFLAELHEDPNSVYSVRSNPAKR